jgi:hypothetical protein
MGSDKESSLLSKEAEGGTGRRTTSEAWLSGPWSTLCCLRGCGQILCRRPTPCQTPARMTSSEKGFPPLTPTGTFLGTLGCVHPLALARAWIFHPIVVATLHLIEWDVPMTRLKNSWILTRLMVQLVTFRVEIIVWKCFDPERTISFV